MVDIKVETQNAMLWPTVLWLVVGSGHLQNEGRHSRATHNRRCQCYLTPIEGIRPKNKSTWPCHAYRKIQKRVTIVIYSRNSLRVAGYYPLDYDVSFGGSCVFKSPMHRRTHTKLSPAAGMTVKNVEFSSPNSAQIAAFMMDRSVDMVLGSCLNLKGSKTGPPSLCGTGKAVP